MCAKYVSGRLLQSQRLSDRGKTGTPPGEKAVAESETSAGGETDAIEPILDRERHASRVKAEKKNLTEVARRKAEVEVKLDESVANLERQQLEAGQEIEFCRELAKKLRATSGEVTAENVGDIRRLVRQADIELLKREREGIDAMAARSSVAPGAASLAEHSFMQLTRVGLGLAWPLIVAIVLAALIVGGCLLAVFNL